MRSTIQQDFTEKYQTPTTAIISALAAATNTDPEEMVPLYQSIDPDALNTLFARTSQEARVEFEHEGSRVEVHSSGCVIVELQDRERGENGEAAV